MKKFVVLLMLLVCVFVSVPIRVDAKTISDYRNDLAALKKKKSDAEANKAAIQAKIDAANKKIGEISTQTAEVVKAQEETKKEIEDLGKKIDVKKEQLNELVAFYQISNNDNFYLKYIFGADSFEDFIYRFSVIEQLTKKSDDLVKEMNDLIDINNKKVKELEAKEKELENLEKQVEAEINSLGDQKNVFMSSSLDIDQEIKAVQQKIDYYVEQGCGENESLSSCLTTIPFDFGFSRPVKHGYINDEMGMRYHPTRHYYTQHNGIDIGGNSEGTPVYAAAAGRVSDVTYKYYCGGNMVTLNHIVNGTYYTTRYLHLQSISVSQGEIVEKGQQIGTVGGGPSTWAWETCSTGAHHHFEMAKGHFYGTGENSYNSWYTYTSKLINPRELVYFPAYGVWW